MAKQTIESSPQWRVNGVPLAIKSNTTKLTTGTPEKMVESYIGENGQPVSVFSQDRSTNVTTLKGEIAATPENQELVIEWSFLLDSNLIEVLGSDSDEVLLIAQNAALTNKPEFSFGSEGSAEVEFQVVIV